MLFQCSVYQKTYKAFVDAKRLDDAQLIKEFFKMHTDNMIRIWLFMMLFHE